MRKRQASLLAFVVFAAFVAAQEGASPLTIAGQDGKKIIFSQEQLKKMPRQTLSITDPHTKAANKYEGVLLATLLAEVKAPAGEALRGKELRDYVEAAGSDNYRVIFSLAELDSMFQDNKVMVADTMDGKPLDPRRGPLQLVVPQDHRPTRWVRALTNVSVRQAP